MCNAPFAGTSGVCCRLFQWVANIFWHMEMARLINFATFWLCADQSNEAKDWPSETDYPPTVVDLLRSRPHTFAPLAFRNITTVTNTHSAIGTDNRLLNHWLPFNCCVYRKEPNFQKYTPLAIGTDYPLTTDDLLRTRPDYHDYRSPNRLAASFAVTTQIPATTIPPIHHDPDFYTVLLLLNVLF